MGCGASSDSKYVAPSGAGDDNAVLKPGNVIDSCSGEAASEVADVDVPNSAFGNAVDACPPNVAPESVPVDVPDNDKGTPLHDAVLHGSVAPITAVLLTGADVNEVSPVDRRRTALHLAAMKGRVDAVTVLLDAGANLASGADVNAVDTIAKTPLHDGCRYVDICALLLCARRKHRYTLQLRLAASTV